MARTRSVATDIDLDQAPAAGGSYVRQPDTGELVQVEGTRHDTEDEDEAVSTADTPAVAPFTAQE